MTSPQDDARDQQARWDDWSIINARSDRRQRRYARVGAVILFTAVTVNLVMALWPRL